MDSNDLFSQIGLIVDPTNKVSPKKCNYIAKLEIELADH